MATINKIPKCPPLRFPDFTDDWQKTTLGTYFKIQGGYAFKSEHYEPFGIPIIRISNLPMNGMYVDLSDCVWYPQKINIDNQFKVQKGDLLIAMSGATTGKTGIYNENKSAYLNQRIGLFLPISIDVFYPILYAYVESDSFKLALDKLLIAGAQPNISPSDIEGIPICLPQSAEQKKIADFLSLIDERIQSCSETIKELKTQKAGLLNQLLSQKLRFPDFNDEWTQTTLGEATIIIMGQSPSSVNYNEEGIGLPLIQGNADMCSGTTIVRLYTSEITKEALKNDIIMSVRAPVGALAITPFRCCIGRGVCAIRADKYIYYYLQLCSKIWSKYSAGSTFDSITGENIRHLPLSLPSLAEQKKIADFLSLIDERIEVEEQLLQQYEKQKRYLLKQMFV